MTYLCDRERTGLFKMIKPSTLQYPEEVWRKKLLQVPIKGAESTAVIDENENIYFGCHDGVFYSLDKNGKIRWQCISSKKIYSSPLMVKNKIIYIANDSDIICINTEGKIEWVVNASSILNKKKWQLNSRDIISQIKLDYHKSILHKIINFNDVYSWGSPNRLNDKIIIVNVNRAGVLAIEVESGKIIWSYSLGFPWFNTGGISVTSVGKHSLIATISQSSELILLDESGELLKTIKLKYFYNAWGSPTIDNTDQCIYCSVSYKNKSSIIYKIDFEGKIVWKSKFHSGIRGAITISKDNFVVVPFLDGEVHKINKKDGVTIQKRKVADSNYGLWTSAIIFNDHHLLINSKKTNSTGSLIYLDNNLEIIWEYKYGKALCVPSLKGDYIYTSAWDGYFYKFKIT